jgi:Family of unknown function (DUF6152)
MPTARAGVVCLAIIVATIAGGTPPLLAHHSFAMFDTARKQTLAGTVTAFEWTNPHVYIELDVADDKGAIKQGGWKFSDVKVGDKITAVVSPLRSGEPGGLLAQITLRDGRVLGNGPGPGGRQ